MTGSAIEDVRIDVRTRSLTAPDGTRWVAFADAAIVAHGRTGAVLAFRLAEGDEGNVLCSTVTFNSMTAADFALGTMSEKDLLRRLSLVRRAAGGV
ncbi:MAG TPA: hypothetical protein VMN39_05550 [Longimicrobiaceae bacterium]|nr:hypothetical protein [Longimicrobiaceae bacterium]